MTKIELNTVFILSIKKLSDKNKKSLRIGEWCSGLCNTGYYNGMSTCDWNFFIGVTFGATAGYFGGKAGMVLGSLGVLSVYAYRATCYDTALTALGICNDGCNPNRILPIEEIPNYYDI